MKTRRVITTGLLIITTAWLASQPAKAATYQWNGTVSTDITASGNWLSGSVPAWGGSLTDRVNVYNSDITNRPMT